MTFCLPSCAPNPFWKRKEFIIPLLKEKNTFLLEQMGSKVFPFSIDPLSYGWVGGWGGRKTIFHKVAPPPPASVSIPLNHLYTASINLSDKVPILITTELTFLQVAVNMLFLDKYWHSYFSTTVLEILSGTSHWDNSNKLILEKKGVQIEKKNVYQWNCMLWVLIRGASWGTSNECPQHIFIEK